MRIEFLGTAAAEAFPDPFCDCQHCEASRRAGGKSLRLRASVLINDDLIIDLGPDLHVAAFRRGASFAGVKYALQTHPHNDHADATTLYMRSDSCLPQGIATLTYALSAPAIAEWERVTGVALRSRDEQETHHLQLREIAPWQHLVIGPYEIQSVKANHAAPDLEAMLFAIRDTRDRTGFFYGTDTGRLPADTWPRLAALGWRFDAIALDHTRGYRSDLPGHLGETGFRAEMAAAREAGAIDESTRVVATHFAHHSHPPHDELEARCAPHGYEPAWDGMVIHLQRRES